MRIFENQFIINVTLVIISRIIITQLELILF